MALYGSSWAVGQWLLAADEPIWHGTTERIIETTSNNQTSGNKLGIWYGNDPEA